MIFSCFRINLVLESKDYYIFCWTVPGCAWWHPSEKPRGGFWCCKWLPRLWDSPTKCKSHLVSHQQQVRVVDLRFHVMPIWTAEGFLSSLHTAPFQAVSCATASQKLAKLVRREPCLARSTAESMREDTPHMFTLVSRWPQHQVMSAIHKLSATFCCFLLSCF